MGTGQQFRRAFVFFEEDVAWGTMGTVGYKLRPTDPLAPRSEQPIITNPVYTGNRLVASPFQDVLSCGLQFTMPLYIDEVGWVLKHMIGNPATTGAGPYVHTSKMGYDGAAIGDIPAGCSFEIQYTDLATPLFHQFIGGRLNEMVLQFRAGGPVTFQCTAVCQSDDPTQTSAKDASPTSYTTDAISHTDVSALTEGGGASAIILEGEIRISNGLDTSLYTCNNAGKIGELPSGRAAVTGRTRFLFQDTAILNKTLNKTESSLALTWTQGAASLALTIPELQYNRATPVPGSGSALVIDANWEAYYGDHADATLIKSVLTNSVATY